MRRAVIGLVFSAGIAACVLPSACQRVDDQMRAPSSAQGPGDTTRQTAAGAGTIGDEPAFDWSPHRGRCVRLLGYVGGAKIGPRLQSGARTIAVALRDPPGDSAWWALPGGSRVRVQGVVTERADLPVIVNKKGEPALQGIAVPEGTDLDKARRRDVLEQASVTPARAVSQVEADMKAAIGKDVSLNGTIWSLNDHWWFNHDGVEVHVEGLDKLPGWNGWHGRVAALHGRLDRRPMPRIDQITLKPDRDLADAFVVSVREVTAHPVWEVESCSNEE